MKEKDLLNRGWVNISEENQNGGWHFERKDPEMYLHVYDSCKIEVCNTRYESFTRITPNRFIGFATVEELDIICNILSRNIKP